LLLLPPLLPATTTCTQTFATPAATTRICADGGANRLYDQIPIMLPGTDPFAARESHLPDLIKGDLDSVREDVTDFYTSRGVPFIDLSSDQETTDLEKCLLFLEGRLRAMSEDAARQTAHAHVAAATAAAAGDTAAVGAGGAGRHGHGAKAIGAANASARAYATGIGPSSSSNGSTGTTLHLDSSSSSAATASTSNAGMGPPTPNGTAADDSSCVQQQQGQQGHQIYGELVMLPSLQDQRQRQQRLHTGPGRHGSSNSSNGAGVLSRLETSQSSVALPGNAAAGGSRQQQRHVHEVTTSILASHDAAGDEPVRKRLQQDHHILVLGELLRGCCLTVQLCWLPLLGSW
jgi:thiamine pyrophosphokinase